MKNYNKFIITVFLVLIAASFGRAQYLNPGDGVRITFFNISDKISGDYLIQQDGNIQLPYLGLIPTENRPYKAIKEEIIAKYDSLYLNPELTVQPLLKINVLGEVKTPGYYYVTDVEKLTGILALAGGVTGSAAADDIYIIRNGEELELSKSEVIEKGNTVADLGLQSGDRIFIPRSFWADAGQYGLILSGVAVLITLVSLVLKK